jgi:hypothetical protein
MNMSLLEYALLEYALLKYALLHATAPGRADAPGVAA